MGSKKNSRADKTSALPSSVKGRPSQDRSVRMPQNNRAGAEKRELPLDLHNGVSGTALIAMRTYRFLRTARATPVQLLSLRMRIRGALQVMAPSP